MILFIVFFLAKRVATYKRFTVLLSHFSSNLIFSLETVIYLYGIEFFSYDFSLLNCCKVQGFNVV